MINDFDKLSKIEVCCPMCLTEKIIEEFLDIDEFDGISVYSDADLVSELLKIFLNSEVDGYGFDLGMVEIDGQGVDYGLEYIFTINQDHTIWIEPAYRNINDKWILFDSESTVTFVNNECNPEILHRLIQNDETVVVFEFE